MRLHNEEEGEVKAKHEDWTQFLWMAFISGSFWIGIGFIYRYQSLSSALAGLVWAFGSAWIGAKSIAAFKSGKPD
jgi:hypothetical protein